MTESAAGDAAEPLPEIPAAGWAPYLEPGERLVWTGAPATGLRFAFADLGPSFVGLVFTVFAIVWTATAAGGPGPAFLPVMGLVPLAIGVYLLIGRRFWAAYRRARTAYALTDRRAIIATRHLGRRLRSFPITPGLQIDFRLGDESTLIFARETDLGQRVGGKGRYRRNVNEIGFEYIPDGPHVARLIRRIQALHG